MSSREFVDTITRDLLGSRVFVFTPKGKARQWTVEILVNSKDYFGGSKYVVTSRLKTCLRESHAGWLCLSEPYWNRQQNDCSKGKCFGGSTLCWTLLFLFLLMQMQDSLNPGRRDEIHLQLCIFNILRRDSSAILHLQYPKTRFICSSEI